MVLSQNSEEPDYRKLYRTARFFPFQLDMNNRDNVDREWSLESVTNFTSFFNSDIRICTNLEVMPEFVSDAIKVKNPTKQLCAGEGCDASNVNS